MLSYKGYFKLLQKNDTIYLELLKTLLKPNKAF